MMKRFWNQCVGLALCGGMFWTSSASANEPADIVDTAVAAGSFKTLAAALQAADLVDALKGPGPFTVFAPTDEAFAKLPEGTVATLLKPENKAKLAAVLTYHVVSGKVLAKQVVGLTGAITLNGQRVDIATSNGAVKVDSATVVKTDIECSNGVIHVIDSVILPASDPIPTVAANAKAFGTLLAAVKAAGLAETLSGEGPFTVFAPTDEAFAKLPKGTVESLLEPANREKLVAILKYHVVSGRVYSDAALKAKSAATLQGANISIGVQSGQAMINKAKLVKTDIDASNGVIHVIDSVLLPPDKTSAAPVNGRATIEHAIAQGSRLFNAGHHGECAEAYENVMRVILDAPMMPVSVSEAARSTMEQVEHMTCPTERAWALRRGLERAYHLMPVAVN